MKSSISVSLKYGVFIALSFIIYFLALKLIGLHTNPWFRVLNGLIMGCGIFMAIRHYKDNNPDFDYGSGFKTGVLTGFIATILFSAFMCVYFFHLDTSFTYYLLQNWFSGFDYGGGILVFIISLEGFSSTFVLTLACMQFLKNSGNVSQNR
jgi:hypothetical protein